MAGLRDGHVQVARHRGQDARDHEALGADGERARHQPDQFCQHPFLSGWFNDC
ncbi:hypothetical protein [Variovorax paradoxus]|uniref:hypothetical protein n=1 Tax=Variovorax paradoxus TaxID=34073 RepID=UPI0024787D3C